MELNRYQIYVGLNDCETNRQEHAAESFEKIVKTVCKGYRIAYSLSEMRGGYYYDDGRFAEEKSLCLTLIGPDDETVDEISKDLCAYFRQESVLVAHDRPECRIVKESLALENRA